MGGDIFRTCLRMLKDGLLSSDSGLICTSEAQIEGMQSPVSLPALVRCRVGSPVLLPRWEWSHGLKA